MEPSLTVAEGLKVEPSLTVTERYDDNIKLSASPRDDDFVTTLTPRLILFYKGPITELSVSYQADAEFFKEHSEQNTVKHTANLNTRYRLSPIAELKIFDRFVYSPDASDIEAAHILDPLGIITIRAKQYSNLVSSDISQQLSSLTNVDIGYRYFIRRNKDPNLVDSTIHGVQLVITRELTPLDTVKAHAEFRYFNFDSFDSAVTQRVYKISLGEKHLFPNALVLDAAGGVNLVQDLNSRYISSAFIDVTLSKTWREASANLRYLRDLTISSVASTVLTNQSLVIEIQAALTQRLKASLSGSYATNKNLSGLSIDVASYSGVAGFDYYLSAWLTGGIRYSYIRQNSHATSASEFSRHQAFVGLTATFPKVKR